jgi:ABC-type polar amino acid transport system ATPase subunit/threonine dehydratase
MIRIEEVTKYYGQFKVLDACATEINDGEVVVICGPSGSGKSTLIKCINALEPYSEGRIFVRDVEVGARGTALPQLRAQVGMVFQHFELFPHLSVLDNLILGQVKILHRKKAEAVDKALTLLARVGLSDQVDKYPAALSGGQQQRVAIARALSMDPAAILFDEPTSALDPEMVSEVLDLIAELAKDGMTMVIVTHEMDFARRVSDRVIFMDRGRIVEDVPTQQFFETPRSERAKEFLSKVVHHSSFHKASRSAARRRRLNPLPSYGIDAMNLSPPTPDDVLDAACQLLNVATRTPLIQSSRLNGLVGGMVFVKLESLQRSGAFKFRGAYNSMSRLDRRQCPKGVLAYSTGNHGQAIATVGALLNIPTTVVMPSDAPQVKIARARLHGAEIVLYDRKTESREEIAARFHASGGYALIPPGDHAHVIAGQGTAALESLQLLGQDFAEMIVVPCGGGGLSAGTCLAADAVQSTAEVWAAEPEAFDDTRRSLESGNRESNMGAATSICDALLATIPAALPFSINRGRLGGVATADDATVLKAMRLLFEEFRVVVEPGGAMAVAALLANPSLLRGRRAIVIASGGNVDHQIFLQAISS